MMAKLKYDPFMLIVDQTVRCNEACFFCWRADPKRVKEKTQMAYDKVYDMPFDMCKEIIDQAAVYKSFRTFNVCGPMGDPLLVSDISERGLYATGKGFKDRMLNTNGVAADRLDMEELLWGYNNIKVSLDTLDEEKYVEMHGKAHLSRVLKNMEQLWKIKNDKNIPGQFKAKVTINEKNQDELDDFKEWSRKTGVPLEMKPVHSFIDHMPEYGNDISMKLCEQPYKTINYNFRGEMTTCCINWHLEPTFGSVYDGDIKSLWEGEEYENWRNVRLDGLCKGCTGRGGRLKQADTLIKLYDQLGEKEFNVNY